MATAFNDSIRNQIDAKRAQNERALQAMQLLASNNQTGATRYGSDRTLDASRLNAGNEATRLQNALMLGREQLTSQEKIAQLGGDFSKQIAQLNFEGMKLPYSDRVMEYNLALAKWNASRPDYRMAGDAMAQNYDASKLNMAAKIAANEANNLLKPALETKMSKRWFNGLTGPLTELEVGDVLTGIKSHPNLGLGKDQIFFNSKSKQFEAIEIPPTTFGVPGGGISVPTAPPNANQLMQLDNPLMGVPPLPASALPAVPRIEPARIEPAWDNPTGAMAVPITQPRAAVAPTNAVPTVPITSRIAADFANARLPVMARPTPDEAMLTNAASPATWATSLVPGAPLLNGILNAYEAIRGYGSLPAADPTAFGAQGSAPGYRMPTGAVAVPVGPTNGIAADIAKLATVGPVAPGTMSTNRASGMTYIFNGSAWQPMPR